MEPSVNQVLRFGQFELYPAAGELRRAGTLVRLQPQPFKLLVFVARRAGELVTREDIRAELWPQGTYVDFDQAVNFAIKQVRDALGDSADRPTYILTVPKRGYRFIAPVDTPGPAEAPREPRATTVRLQKALWANIAEIRVAQRRQKRLTILAIAAAVVAILALVSFLIVR